MSMAEDKGKGNTKVNNGIIGAGEILDSAIWW